MSYGNAGGQRRRAALLSASSLILALPAAAPALAADDAADAGAEVEEIVVTGQREAQRAAIAVKREEFVVADVVSADDIGKLPEATENLITLIEAKLNAKRACIAKLDVGPKGALVSFHDDKFPNVDGLLAYVDKLEGTAKLRPDMKLVIAQAASRHEARHRPRMGDAPGAAQRRAPAFAGPGESGGISPWRPALPPSQPSRTEMGRSLSGGRPPASAE